MFEEGQREDGKGTDIVGSCRVRVETVGERGCPNSVKSKWLPLQLGRETERTRSHEHGVRVVGGNSKLIVASCE